MKNSDGSSRRYDELSHQISMQREPTGPRAMVTQDHDLIRHWAEKHRAEPATGEATASGPATMKVNDGGAGIRFNFPGLHRFRPISWDEWFGNFDEHDLEFVYEEEVADRAYELWQTRGGEPGRDREDWFEAEEQLRGPRGATLGRYRIIKKAAEKPSKG